MPQATIPIQAIEHSREYTTRYSRQVDLITLFPTFSMDKSDQLACSLGAAGWQSPCPSNPLVRDWFPAPVDYQSVISLIVRPCANLSCSSIPLSLLAHFAPVDSQSLSRSSRPSTASSPSTATKPARRAPAVLDISPSASVDDLKRQILAIEGRTVSRLEKVVLWKVDMSENEMIVIEERGGLKSGQMPWPYPPTAEVPVKLEDGSDLVGNFWNASNPRMVAISVWISPSAALSTGSNITDNTPVFTYPMVFPYEPRRTSTSHSLPNRSPTPDVVVAVTSSTLPSARGGRRGRPSTAPAMVDSTGIETGSIAPHAFGTRRARSPLAPRESTSEPLDTGRVKGLGIGAPNEVDIDMSRLRLNVSLGPEATEDGKVVWYQPGGGRGGVRRADSVKGIRSLSHNKSLRPYEVV